MLREEQIFYSSIENGSLAFIELHENGHVAGWRGAAEWLCDWAAREVLGRPLPLRLDRTDEELLSLLDVTGGLSGFVGLQRITRKNGMSTVAIWQDPRQDENGDQSGIILTLAPLPEKSLLAIDTVPEIVPHEHIQSHLRFRDLLEAAPDAILEVNRDGAIMLLNAAAENMFGYQREELFGQPVEILIPQGMWHRHAEHRNDHAAHPSARPMGSGLELFARHKDGSEFPAEISLSPIRSLEGTHVIAIVRDITARKQAEARINALHARYAAELAVTNEQLAIRNHEVERANQLKSEFLASMSHELRTPLHTIIGFSDLLSVQSKGALNPQQQRFVEHIQRDSRHLLELINGILDLRKIEEWRLELHPESFNASAAVTETMSGLRPLAVNKQIDLSEKIDRNLHIFADRVRFKEILYNLASNAIKFTPEKGSIRIEGSQRIDGSLFSVIDTGLGIPESEQQAIFAKFYQVSATTRRVKSRQQKTGR